MAEPHRESERKGVRSFKVGAEAAHSAKEIEQLVVTFNVAMGEIVKVEEVDKAGKHQELAPCRLRRMRNRRFSETALIILPGVLLIVLVAAPFFSQSVAAHETAFEFNDAHFHLTNYIQEGTPIRDFLQIMGTTTGTRRYSAYRCSNSGRMASAVITPPNIIWIPTLRSTTTRSPMLRSRWPIYRSPRWSGNASIH